MNIEQTVNSILAADFGATHTRAILIDLVDGQYRLVASARAFTTLGPPHGNVQSGLIHAITNIEQVTNRRLMDDNGLLLPEKNGEGIDRLIITSSAGRPLSTVLLGLMPNVSIHSAVRALTGTYIDVSATLTISDQGDLESQINTVLKANPDLIFVSGGTDGGNQEGVLRLVELAELATRLAPPDERPIVLYAGNNLLVDRVQEIFADNDARLLIASNVRPNLMKEDLGNARVELARAFSDHVARQPGGFEMVADVGITPTAQGVSNVLRWLSETYDRPVVHVDIGSATSTFSYGFAEDLRANIYSDMGIGHSVLTTVEKLGYEAIIQWLSFSMSEAEILEYAHNKVLRPSTLPSTLRDLIIEQAFVRAIMKYMIEDARTGFSRHDYAQFNMPALLLLAGASLTEGLHPGIATMIALDSLQFHGMIEVYADPYSVLPAIGAVAYEEPAVAVQVYENAGLTYIGTVFATVGATRGTAMKIKIEFEDGQKIKHNLDAGEIWSYSAPVGQIADITVSAGRGAKIGGKGRIKQRVTFGTGGVIFDGRGRPFASPPPDQRADIYSKWWAGATHGQLRPVLPVDEGETSAEVIDLKVKRREVDKLKNEIAKAIIEAERREEIFGEVLNSSSEAKSRRGRQQRRRPSDSDLDDIIDQL